MAKKPNAADITKALALLGGGAKKDGGGGMLQGAQNIFKSGLECGEKLALNTQQQAKEIETAKNFLIEDKSDNK